MIHLRPRLLAIARRVPSGARVADIGTDHGRLPLWLLQQGVTGAVTAADIADGPLRRVEALAARVGLRDRLTIIKSDGLKALKPDEYDTLVIAGMGGETIMDILTASPWGLAKHMVLQPMSRPERLAAYLDKVGVAYSEFAVTDAKRRYCIFESK